jgi:hypothetical protein
MLKTHYEQLLIFKRNAMKIEIIKTHIENDLVNDFPTLVFTDKLGKEWVLEIEGRLVLKENSWYFNPANAKKQ